MPGRIYLANVGANAACIRTRAERLYNALARAGAEP